MTCQKDTQLYLICLHPTWPYIFTICIGLRGKNPYVYQEASLCADGAKHFIQESYRGQDNYTELGLFMY